MNKGQLAEQAVAKLLADKKFKVIELNWRAKACEVDIVAKRDNRIYLVEVKYRSSSSFGEGYEYVARAKRSKLELAARLWPQINNWSGEIAILIASVSGPNFEEIELIEYLP